MGRIEGLKQGTENGTEVVLLEYWPMRGRWKVRLPDARELSIAAKNLVPLADAGSRGEALEELTLDAGMPSEFIFHCLTRDSDFDVEVSALLQEKLPLSLRGRTLEWSPSLVGAGISDPLFWESYIEPEVRLGSWICRARGEFMWLLVQSCTYERYREIWDVGMFSLPERGITLCPNPVSRFCLRVGPQEEQRWGKGKKLRRYAKDFRLSISHDFLGSLEKCRRYHLTGRQSSTWITKELMEYLDRFRRDPQAQVESCCFELWEGTELVAATFNFSRGFVFHDYTMCTMKKDHRSIGSVLTKAVGNLLCQAGYRCWYWGFKVPYMAEYDEYGSHHLSREEFWRLWCPGATEGGTAAASPEGPCLAKLQLLLKEGKAMVPPLVNEPAPA